MVSPVPDGDIFAKLGRLAAPVADAIRRALEGAVWDPSYVYEFLRRLLSGGVQSLPGVVGAVGAFANAPLLAGLPEAKAQVVSEIDDLTRGSSKSQLDLILRSAAQRSLLQGEYDPAKVLKRFLLDICDGAVVSPRGGLIDQLGHECRQPSLELLVPTITEVARQLAGRPGAKRLDVPKPVIDSNSDLLG